MNKTVEETQKEEKNRTIYVGNGLQDLSKHDHNKIVLIGDNVEELLKVTLTASDKYVVIGSGVSEELIKRLKGMQGMEVNVL